MSEIADRYRRHADAFEAGARSPGVEVYGPEVKVSEDAPLQGRLLGLIGRDPD